MRAINQVPVVGERNTRIRVAKLTLCDLGRGARLEECRGVQMAKRMEPRTRDLQRITQWPQSFVNNRVRRVWLALPVCEHDLGQGSLGGVSSYFPYSALRTFS